jgi:MSHA biogenesis protein MshJ
MNELLIQRFNQFSSREKAMVLGTLLVIVWSIFDSVAYQPLSTELDQLSNELSSIKLQLSNQQQTAEQIENLAKTDINGNNRTQQQQLKNRIKQLKQQLGESDKQFVPAHLMAEVLGNILKQNTGLELIHLETLAVTPLSQTTQGNAWVYRHGLAYTFRGNYFITLSYLKSLESLPWRFHWDSIDYQVKEYPIAESTIRIYTLSFEENWLGL